MIPSFILAHGGFVTFNVELILVPDETVSVSVPIQPIASVNVMV